jgi:hypothetical protein
MSVAAVDYDWRERRSPPQRWTGFVNADVDPVPAARPLVSPQSTASRPQWFEPTLRRIVELLELGPNWDGRGSAAVNRDALSFALHMLWQTMGYATAAPSMVPLGNGGVQLLWSNASAEIEVEVIRPNEIMIYYLNRQAGADREWRAETEFSELADLLRAHFM